MKDVIPNLTIDREHWIETENHGYFAHSGIVIGCSALQRPASFHKNEHDFLLQL